MVGVETIVQQAERDAAEALEAKKRRQEEKLEVARLVERLETMGYEVALGYAPGARRYECIAFYGGRMVAYAYGTTELEALRGALGELGG